MKPNIAAVVLMGGQNKRMNGNHKAFLTLEGKTFLEITCQKLMSFSNIYLSVDKVDKFNFLTFPAIEDCYSQIGPLGGIYSAFKALPDFDYLFFVSCDTPFITSESIDYLLSCLTPADECIAFSDDEGFVFPLGALYSKSMLPQIETKISEGNYRLQALIRQSKCKLIPLSCTSFSPSIFRNINTPEEYQACLKDFDSSSL